MLFVLIFCISIAGLLINQVCYQLSLQFWYQILLFFSCASIIFDAKAGFILMPGSFAWNQNESFKDLKPADNRNSELYLNTSLTSDQRFVVALC